MSFIYGQKIWIFSHLQKAYSAPQVKNRLCSEVVIRNCKNCTDRTKCVSICNYYFAIPN